MKPGVAPSALLSWLICGLASWALLGLVVFAVWKIVTLLLAVAA